MPWSIADTRYDNTHPWDSMFNGVPLSHVLQQTPREQALMKQSMTTMNPQTPEAFIRDTMTVPPVSDPGPRPPEPGIEDVLSGQAPQPRELYARSPSDYSGTPAGIEASSVPSLQAAQP